MPRQMEDDIRANAANGANEIFDRAVVPIDVDGTSQLFQPPQVRLFPDHGVDLDVQFQQAFCERQSGVAGDAGHESAFHRRSIDTNFRYTCYEPRAPFMGVGQFLSDFIRNVPWQDHNHVRFGFGYLSRR